ncbi:hypothetical protein ACA910_018497 [Epithemia clementina (nom. ined.)]
MSKPPATEEPVEDLDYIGEEEDDDDEEDDFVPGEEVEDDDDDDDDASSTVVPLLDGVLYFGAQHALHYQGEGFQLAANDSAPWNILDSKAKPETDKCELIMAGPCDFETAGAKATPRKFKVTFMVSEPPTTTSESSNDHITKGNRGKSVIQHIEDDGKSDSKASGIYYKVFGSQIESNGGDLMEFLGGYHPPSTDEEKVGLVCQVRMVPASTTNPAAGAAAVGAAAPVAAAAAAASAATRIDDEEEGDEDEEADEEVDYNELIALHEDAGMSMDDLKKRYREEEEEENGNNNKPNSVTRASRRNKRKPPPAAKDDDDDDDDYVGF